MENKDEHSNEEHSDVEFYGDPGIASADARVPRWLVINNWFWVFLGLFLFYYFINGSHGWLDRGYWGQLQRAANTTFPFTTREIIEHEAAEKNAARQNPFSTKRTENVRSQSNPEKSVHTEKK